MMPVKALLNCMSPAGVDARLSVLIFHRVLVEPDALFPNEMHARRFETVCGWLAAWFDVLPLDQAVTRLKSGTLPARAACISFDDGYADNYHIALPILQRHGLSACFFIATGFLNGGRMWNDSIVEAIRACSQPVLDLSSLNLGRHGLGTIEDRRLAISSLIKQIKYQSLEARITLTEQIARLAQAQLPADLMMTSSEIMALRRAGMQIGAHTVSHPILARLSDEQARREIVDSQQFLQGLLGESVELFAYPNGKPGEDYSPRTVEIVRSLGFAAALSTQWGTTGINDDCFQMPRFTPWDASRWRFGLRMLNNLRKA
jgi:peptidoglycan/xylan/chitin deacetylase (PgdA/CDA1 family)